MAKEKGCAGRGVHEYNGNCWQGLLICLSIILCLLSFSPAAAQEDPEYRMEVGGGVGTVSYLGDFNGNLMKNMQVGFSVVGKYRFNPRMAMGLTVTYSTLKGSSNDEKSYYPEVQTPVEFSNALVDASLRYEYNFWPFGTGREYHGARHLTPFVTMGLGMTYANAKPTALAANLPLGVGVKYKIGDRMNLTGEWTVHFTGSDKLDGVEDPYGIKSSGLFKNTDCYSMLKLSLTFDFWAKCKTCNNDRD